jgi:hypothetical protein
MTLLFLIALALAIVGVVRVAQGDIVVGAILLVLACAIGPGGFAIYK